MLEGPLGRGGCWHDGRRGFGRNGSGSRAGRPHVDRRLKIVDVCERRTLLRRSRRRNQRERHCNRDSHNPSSCATRAASPPLTRRRKSMIQRATVSFGSNSEA